MNFLQNSPFHQDTIFCCSTNFLQNSLNCPSTYNDCCLNLFTKFTFTDHFGWYCSCCMNFLQNSLFLEDYMFIAFWTFYKIHFSGWIICLLQCKPFTKFTFYRSYWWILLLQLEPLARFICVSLILYYFAVRIFYKNHLMIAHTSIIKLSLIINVHHTKICCLNLFLRFICISSIFYFIAVRTLLQSSLLCSSNGY